MEKPYNLTKNFLLFFDAFLAFLIIFTAKTIVLTEFGKAALIFGLVMLTIITVLKFLDKF